MSKVLKSVISSLALVVLLASPADAGLVTVLFDNFTAPDANPTTVFNDGDGVTVQRYRDGGAVLGSFVGAFSGQNLQLNYFAAPTFGQLFDKYKGGGGPLGTLNPNSMASFTGFQVNITNFNSATGTVSDGNQTFNISGSSSQSFVFGNYANSATTFFLTINLANAPSGSSIGVQNVAAIPEPSAMILVTSMAGLGFIRRRKG